MIPLVQKKTSHKRLKSIKAWQQHKFDQGCCKVCGNKMSENDFRVRCESCNRWHNIRMMANRAFMKDFK